MTLTSKITNNTPLKRIRSSKVCRWIASTALDQRGVAAVEFALVAPIMLMFYFGMVEVSLAIQADRNLSSATALVGDLTAQDEEATISMVEDYIYGALAVLGVDRAQADDVGLELYSFEVTSDDNPATATDDRVIESVGFASFGPSFDGGTLFDPMTIESRILSSSSGVVVARMNYEYTPRVTENFVGTKTFKETFILKPRRSAIVRFNNGASDGVNMSCRLQTMGADTEARCTPSSSP